MIVLMPGIGSKYPAGITGEALVPRAFDEFLETRLGTKKFFCCFRPRTCYPFALPMSALDFLENQLALLEKRGILRVEDAGEDGIDFCSNDYLGYGREPVSRATLLACEGVRGGAGASRLIHGTQPQHLELEREVAEWVSLPSALLFSSGYTANVSLISALCGPADLVVSDRLNHASLIDGCRLARAEVRVVPHRDPTAVARALASSGHERRWVLTESYFSMDGDQADLAELRGVCDAAGAGLIVDEAHALGVFGPEGGGLCRASGVVPDALVGTLGKAVGAQGAFVAGSKNLRRWLWNRARSFVFSTAPAPIVARLALEHVRRARADGAGRARLLASADRLADQLRKAGLDVPGSARGPIIPLLLRDNARTVALAAALRAEGFRVQAIRPPTVPEGGARLRLTVSAVTSDSELDRVAACLIRTCNES